MTAQPYSREKHAAELMEYYAGRPVIYRDLFARHYDWPAARGIEPGELFPSEEPGGIEFAHTDDTNAIVGRWLRQKMRRAIAETPEGEGPRRGHFEFGPYGRAALNLKKQGAPLAIARLILFGRA